MLCGEECSAAPCARQAFSVTPRPSSAASAFRPLLLISIRALMLGTPRVPWSRLLAFDLQQPRLHRRRSPPKLYDMLGVDEKYDTAAAGFIRKAVQKQQPFFLYFCSHHTHAPQFAPEGFLGYSRRGLQGDSLGLIDRSAGRLMNLTKELGIDNNTLLVFSADNGGSLHWRELGGVNGDLRCGKGTTYEGGHRVPLIARWPGRVPAGVVIDELTSSLDWFPTFLGLAGVPLPTDRVIDGMDISDVLFGTGPTPRTTFLYFEWRTARLMAVRIGPWKLHMFTRGSHCTPPFPDANCYDMDFKVCTPAVVFARAALYRRQPYISPTLFVIQSTYLALLCTGLLLPFPYPHSITQSQFQSQSPTISIITTTIAITTTTITIITIKITITTTIITITIATATATATAISPTPH